MFKYLIHFFLLIFTGILSDQDFPEVRIEQGVLRGRHRQTWNGRTFNSFSGIPYAKPPVGELRFKPPVPAEPWNGILEASAISPICPQTNVLLHDFEIKGTEDCLYLNVYAPQLKPTAELLPVLFFIHGGGFFLGSGNPHLYGPDILLDKDVILVTINYRLGALGFLSTEDEFLPGNWGLKDQNLALKWVKRNIIHFGGDSDKIVVFGQSAGGASTHYQVLSPLSKGLLSGAIAHSGIATAVWALAPEGQALTNANRLAEYVDCPSKSKVDMIDCLRRIDAYDIIAQEKKFMVYSYYPAIPFKPVIEPNHKGAFITEDPIDIIKSGKSAKIPFITGITSEDGAIASSGLYNNLTLIEELNKDFERLAPILFMYEDNPNKDEVTKKIRHFYFGDRDIDESTKTELTDLFTDWWFLYPQAAAVQLHAKYTEHPVYYYIFGIKGEHTHSKLFGDPGHDYGVCHGDELFSLFSTVLFPGHKPNEATKKCIDIMTSIWTDFARTGKPTPVTNSLIKLNWEAAKHNNLASYSFRTVDDIKMTTDTYKNRIEFWKTLKFHIRSSRINDEL